RAGDDRAGRPREGVRVADRPASARRRPRRGPDHPGLPPRLRSAPALALGGHDGAGRPRPAASPLRVAAPCGPGADPRDLPRRSPRRASRALRRPLLRARARSRARSGPRGGARRRRGDRPHGPQRWRRVEAHGRAHPAGRASPRARRRDDRGDGPRPPPALALLGGHRPRRGGPMIPRYRAIGWRDHVIGLALCVSYVALLIGTSGDLGMSRDEGFYVEAAQRYGAWFELLVEDPSRALERDVISSPQHWGYNNEHPSLAKAAFALSHLAHERWGLFPEESTAFRFPGMLSAGLLLWVLYIFGARAYGRQAGVFAALAFALLPRIFYHSHLDCFDVPIVLMMTLVTYCYWRSLTDVRWALTTGLTYGLALATKHNAWQLP